MDSQRPACPCGKLVRVAFARYRTFPDGHVAAYCGVACARSAEDDVLASLPCTTWIAIDADDEPAAFPFDVGPRTRVARLGAVLGGERAGLFVCALTQNPARYADPRWNLLARSIWVRKETAPQILADILDEWVLDSNGDLDVAFRWERVCARLQLDALPTAWLAHGDVWGIFDAMAQHLPEALRQFRRQNVVGVCEPDAGVSILQPEPARQVLQRWLALRMAAPGVGAYDLLASGFDASVILRDAAA